jgi:hypothetical protein
MNPIKLLCNNILIDIHSLDTRRNHVSLKLSRHTFQCVSRRSHRQCTNSSLIYCQEFKHTFRETLFIFNTDHIVISFISLQMFTRLLMQNFPLLFHPQNRKCFKLDKKPTKVSSLWLAKNMKQSEKERLLILKKQIMVHLCSSTYYVHLFST